MSALSVHVAARPAHRAERRRTGAPAWLGQVLAWTVMLFVGAALLVAVVLPRVAGGSTYVIETGSMRPHLPPGTLIAIRPVDPDRLRVGDVITYQLHSGDPTVVTHRIVAVGYDGRGRKSWKTQGDANNVADAKIVRPVQVRGRLWYHVPRLGYLTALVTEQQRGLLVGALALGSGGYALAMFGGAWRDRRRGRLGTTTG